MSSTSSNCTTPSPYSQVLHELHSMGKVLKTRENMGLKIKLQHFRDWEQEGRSELKKTHAQNNQNSSINLILSLRQQNVKEKKKENQIKNTTSALRSPSLFMHSLTYNLVI